MTFNFSIGSYFSSNNIKIKYQKGELLCNRLDMPGFFMEKPKMVSVKSNPDWEKLLLFLEACKWENEYADYQVLDGTQWELKATRRNRFKLRVYGDNVYPSDFKQFEKLLNKVIAETGWQIDETNDE